MTAENTIENQYTIINKKEQEIGSKIKELMMKKNRILDIKRSLAYGMIVPNTPTLERVPETYILNYNDDNVKNSDFLKISKEWVKYIPYINLVFFIPFNIDKQDVDDEILQTYLSLKLYKNDLEMLNDDKLIDESFVKKIPESKYIFIRLIVDNIFFIQRKYLEPLLSYINKECYKVTEDLMVHIYDLHYEDGKTKYNISVRAKIDDIRK